MLYLHRSKDNRNAVYIKRKKKPQTFDKMRGYLEKIIFSIYLSNTFSCILSCLYGQLAVWLHFSESLYIKYTIRNNPKDTEELKNSFRMSYKFSPARGEVTQEKYTNREGTVPSTTPFNDTKLSSLTSFIRGSWSEKQRNLCLVIQVNKKGLKLCP